MRGILTLVCPVRAAQSLAIVLVPPSLLPPGMCCDCPPLVMLLSRVWGRVKGASAS